MKRSLILLLALLFGLSLVIFSVVPISRTAIGTRPHFAATPEAIHHAAVFHVVVHLFIFSLAACIAWFAAAALDEVLIWKLVAVVLTLLLGCGTEYLEHTVSGLPIELNDIFTNTVASSLTFGLLALIANYRRRAIKNCLPLL